ncbi:MAG TPA: bifunctional nuclease domain-containing protein [Chloroflexota bacterium]|nr:bifunctional nuclease domain-containing protein [Chloroflexota bacterium]
MADRLPPERLSGERGLITRAQRGDAAAFACLAEHYQSTLDRFCRRLMHDPTIAQDLHQETLLRADESVHRLEEPSRFGAWLFGIATNLARWWWRRQRRWPLSLDSLSATHPDVPWTAAFPQGTWAFPPDHLVEAADERQRLQAAIEALPPELGRVVALHYLQGLSYSEVAAMLSVPVSTIRRRLFTSRARLLRATLHPEHAKAPQRSTSRMAPKNTSEPSPHQPALVRVTVERVRRRLAPVTVEGLTRVLTRAPFARSMRLHAVPPTPTEGGASRGAAPPAPRESDSPTVADREGAVTQFTAPFTAPYEDAVRDLAERMAPAIAAAGVFLLDPGLPAMVLREEQGERELSFAIGPAEADALAMALQGFTAPRPLSHDLMGILLQRNRTRLERVAITRREQETYCASLTLRQDGHTRGARTALVEVDARPSDAVNLALRTGAPIYVAEHLLQIRSGPAQCPGLSG